MGKLARADIIVAHAVTASAAYPLFLPALDELLLFNRRDGSRGLERVALTDGGVYDNLGLAPLWPGRDPSVSLNVSSVDTIICCRAGYGLRHDPPSQFLIGRLVSAFACIHDRAQNAAMNRLFELRESGKLQSFVLPYLGQDDSRLKFPPADLVTREEAYAGLLCHEPHLDRAAQSPWRAADQGANRRACAHVDTHRAGGACTVLKISSGVHARLPHSLRLGTIGELGAKL